MAVWQPNHYTKITRPALLFNFDCIIKGLILLSSNLADLEFSKSFLCTHTLSLILNSSFRIFISNLTFCFFEIFLYFCRLYYVNKGVHLLIQILIVIYYLLR